MNVDTNTAEKSLLNKGFKREKRKKHKFFYFYYNGLKSGIYTMISHGSGYKDISGRLLNDMKRQLKLETNHEAVDFLDCTMSEDEYIEILLENDIL
jgi:hypothetical protein